MCAIPSMCKKTKQNKTKQNKTKKIDMSHGQLVAHARNRHMNEETSSKKQNKITKLQTKKNENADRVGNMNLPYHIVIATVLEVTLTSIKGEN